MTNFYFEVLLGKDVKKVTDTNGAEAQGPEKVPDTFNSPRREHKAPARRFGKQSITVMDYRGN